MLSLLSTDGNAYACRIISDTKYKIRKDQPVIESELSSLRAPFLDKCSCSRITTGYPLGGQLWITIVRHATRFEFELYNTVFHSVSILSIKFHFL